MAGAPFTDTVTSIHYKVWDEITYAFPNFNSYTVEVWEWLSHFFPHFEGMWLLIPAGITSQAWTMQYKSGLHEACQLQQNIALFMTLAILQHIDGFVQEKPNSIANALELHLFCTNPSKYHILNSQKTPSVWPWWVSYVLCVVWVFNSLRPSDAIWGHRSGSTLAQVMACCLTAPSHYLNQCWLIISKV